jgi:hypothetical protein
VRCTQFIDSATLSKFNDALDYQPEEEQTFTRREKHLYEQATGQQRKTKRSNAKRKTSKVGEEVPSRRKANS